MLFSPCVVQGQTRKDSGLPESENRGLSLHLRALRALVEKRVSARQMRQVQKPVLERTETAEEIGVQRASGSFPRQGVIE
jgi:hypothetical protein